MDDDTFLGNTCAGSDDENESNGITCKDDTSDVVIANVEPMEVFHLEDVPMHVLELLDNSIQHDDPDRIAQVLPRKQKFRSLSHVIDEDNYDNIPRQANKRLKYYILYITWYI